MIDVNVTDESLTNILDNEYSLIEEMSLAVKKANSEITKMFGTEHFRLSVVDNISGESIPLLDSTGTAVQPLWEVFACNHRGCRDCLALSLFYASNPDFKENGNQLIFPKKKASKTLDAKIIIGKTVNNNFYSTEVIRCYIEKGTSPMYHFFTRDLKNISSELKAILKANKDLN